MKPTAWRLPRWMAHRGAGKLAPENTLAAFRVGAAHGYRGFECDVKLSADDVPFLLHDDTLERTTTGQGIAGHVPWSELSRLDAGGWHSRQYAGEPPPSLAAVARFVQRQAAALNVEIKPTTGQEYHTGRLVGAACAALWQGSTAPLLLSSFKVAALQGAMDAAPQLPRALLVDTLWDGWWEAAESLACVAVVTHHRLMDAALVSSIHGAGMRALSYTVNAAEDADRLLKLGIDGLITDAVDVWAPAVPSRGETP